MSIHLSRVLRRANDFTFMHYCPGCKSTHQFWVNPPSGPSWTYDGNAEKPTVSPSLRHSWGPNKCCHYFIRKGNLVFCGDCTHALAGQTVPMQPFPRLDQDIYHGDEDESETPQAENKPL